jgi:hypothetical protein
MQPWRAYSQIMYEIVCTVRRKAKRFGVAYIIDESNDSTKILSAFDAMKIHHPIVGRSAKTCAPFDDKETPALQMADLLASACKDIFIEWIASGRKYPEAGKWCRNLEPLGKWDANHMVRSLIRTVKHPRFSAGTLVPQPVPEVKITKGERKRQRRAQWKNKVMA